MKSIGASAYHKNYLQVGAVVQAAVLAAVAVELEAVAAVGDSLRASPPLQGSSEPSGGPIALILSRAACSTRRGRWVRRRSRLGA